jgi:hypothetical protein
MYSLDTRYAFDTEYQDLRHQEEDDDSSDERVALRLLMQKGEIATLSRFPIQDPKQTADLCLELVMDHPESVAVLLWNREVRDAFATLLGKPMHRHRGQDRWERATMLALDTGLPPEWFSGARSDQRRKSFHTHVAEKSAKHKNHTWQVPGRVSKVYEVGKPAPYRGLHVNSLLNQNGKIRDALCRHMAWEATMAFMQGCECFKQFLCNVAEGTYPFDVDTLEHLHYEHVCDSSDSRVQFTPQHFGRLLVRLLSCMKPGERQGHLICWNIPKDLHAHGHEMAVLLEKGDDGIDKVWLYDPNVSGNALHIKTSPDRLSSHSIAVYDALDYIVKSANVLSMDIGNRTLAKAWAGHFIESDDITLLESFVEALANGTVHEMAAALKTIRNWNAFAHMHTEVRRALTMAVQWGHAQAIEWLAQWLHTTEVHENFQEAINEDAEQAAKLWSLALNNETMLDLLTREEEVPLRTATALAYLNLLAGASRHMNKASKRELYQILHAFQNGSPCCYERLSWGHQLLSRDAGFRTAFEQLMAKLKFW